jgi:amidophosphoribosyltransferase
LVSQDHSHCFFEWIYFADPTSIIEKKSVYEVRKELGRILARRYVDRVGGIDFVMASPDSGRGVAIGFQQELSNLLGKFIPYEEAAIKNPGAKRTFQVEGEIERGLAASLKFFMNRDVVRGKKIAVGDDSIVRGTVFRDGMIRKLRRAGASEIYPVISCPPLVHACIKDPHGTGFAAHGFDGSLEEIGERVARKINADFVCYPSEKDMRTALGLEDICAACVNGCFPVNEVYWK